MFDVAWIPAVVIAAVLGAARQSLLTWLMVVMTIINRDAT